LNTEADGMSEATRTRETFNTAIKEVCDTFKMEISHEEQQKAMDCSLMGKDVFISLHAMALATVLF